DLDEHVRVEQPGREHQCRHRSQVPEDRTVRPPDRVGAVPADDEHPGPRDVLHRHPVPPGRLERYLEGEQRLRIRVADMLDDAVDRGGAAGRQDPRAGPNHPRVPVDVLPAPARAKPLDHWISDRAVIASATVKAPVYRALPTITPSTPAGSRAES